MYDTVGMQTDSLILYKTKKQHILTIETLEPGKMTYAFNHLSNELQLSPRLTKGQHNIPVKSVVSNILQARIM